MRELAPYLRLLAGRRLRLLVGGLLLFAATAAGTGLLALSGWFITATGVTALLWAAGTMVAFDIYVPGGAIRAFAVTRTVARYGERLYNHDTVLRVLADLRRAVFARLAVLDAATLARFRAADLLSRLTADIDALDALYLRALAPPAVALAAAAAVTGLLAIFSAVAAALVGALLLALWALLVAAGWRGGALPSERAAGAGAVLRARVIEQVEGLGELIAFGALERHRAGTDRVMADLERDQRRLAARTALGDAAAAAGVQLAGVAALLIGVWLERRGTVSAPVVVLMALVPLGLGELFGALPGGFLQLGRSRAAARRLNAQTATRTGLRDAESPRPAPGGNEVRFEGVRFAHGPLQPPVLDGFELVIRDGERVAVLGRSGAGKSTVADLLVRRADPAAGRVCLGGVPLDALALATLRARVGYLTQASELFDDTVAGNLRIADPGAADRRLWQALAVAGLDVFVAGLPRGLETPVGESGAALSGGQARRLALARVVLRDPAVVVLDEPLSGLDAATAASVARRLDAWLAGRTALLLAHAPDVLPPHDRAMHLSGGGGSGPHAPIHG